MMIKILLADDHTIVREGLRALIENQPDMEVIGEAENGCFAVNLARKRMPNVVLMDICMPAMNGIEATRRIKNFCPDVRVLGLSASSDRRYVIELLRAGASGYLLKDTAFAELADAIRAVTLNQTYLSTAISDIVVMNCMNKASDEIRSAYSLLSPREREVLQLIAEGNSTKEMAALLGISVKTVETHRRQIMDKLDTHSIAELTKYAIREGLTTIDS